MKIAIRVITICLVFLFTVNAIPPMTGFAMYNGIKLNDIYTLYDNTKFSFSPREVPDELSSYIKIKYEFNAMVSVNIYDINGIKVAEFTEDKVFGFDGPEMFVISLVFLEGEYFTLAIYMPNQGYKLEFSHGDKRDVPIDLSMEISTLDADGYKTASVFKNENMTIEDDVLSVVDGTSQAILSSNIDTMVEGDVVKYYTDWYLPDSAKVNIN